MPFDPSPVFQHKRWKEIEHDPVKLEKAQSKLFTQYVAASPERQNYFDQAEPEERTRLREEFAGRLETKYPDAFKSLTAYKTIRFPSINEQVSLNFKVPQDTEENRAVLEAAGVDPPQKLSSLAKRSIARGFGKIGRTGGSILDAVDDYISTVGNNVRGQFWGIADRMAPAMMERKRREQREARPDGEITSPEPRMIDEAGNALWNWSNRFIENNEERLPRPPLAENPRQLLDASWWAENLPEQAVYYVPAVLAGLLSGGSAGVAGLTAGLLESGEDYTALKEDGVRADEAFARAALGVAAISTLNRAGFNPVFKKGGGNAIKRAISRFVAEGTTEYVEEPTQLATRDLGRVSGEEFERRLAQTLVEALDVIPLAGVSGAAGGVAADMRGRKVRESARDALKGPEGQRDGRDRKRSPDAPPVAEEVVQDKAALLKPEPEAPSTTRLDEVKFPITEVPVSEITLSKDVPNFKEDANPDTGEVRGKELQGEFDRRGTGPIIVWQRANGDKEVISGRHRLALARRSGEKTIPAQVVSEADGFDQAQALVLDAELNIRDGQGAVRDYADYFRNREGISYEEARQTNLLRDAKGHTGWHIGKGASDDLYAAYRAGKISEPKAAAIGELAPGDPAVQAAAMADARKLTVADLREYTKSLTAAPKTKAPDDAQDDLFGFDDSVLEESRLVAKQAAKALNQSAEQERTLRQAITRGGKLELTTAQAKALGIRNRKSRDQLARALEQVQSERAVLERWHTDRDLMNRFREEAGLPVIGSSDAANFQPLEEAQAVSAAAYRKSGSLGVAGNVEGMAGGASQWPGGPLQNTRQAGAPLGQANDRMAALPIEMPEMVQIYKALTRGQYPAIQKRMGNKIGYFRYTEGPTGSGTIALRADTFDLVTPNEKLRIREKAEADAKAMEQTNGQPVNVDDLYKFRLQQAYDDAATKNPVLASKVMAHELMHFVDYLPDKTLKRGNLLGHVAAFKGYLMRTLADSMGNEAKALTKADRAKIRRIAQQEVGKRPADPEARKQWADQVSRVYAEKVERVMAERGLLSLNAMRAELEPVIAWWRGTETMEEYFKPAKEMFAEAGSIFLNNPAALRQRAPKFYSALMGWMRARPEWERRYNRMQDDIRSGKIYTDRVKNLRESVLDATETAAQLDRVANRRTMRERWDAFLYTMHRQFGPVYSRLKKVENANQVHRTKQAISDYLYRKAHHELYLGRIRNEVLSPLLDANLDSVDMFEYMFHQHVIHNRANIANPFGWTTKASGERIAEMRKEFGASRMKALEDAQAAFWKVRQEEVIDALERAEVFDQETMDIIKERQFYATIAALKDLQAGDPDAIASRLRQRYGQVVGNIYKQTGYMGDIKNPFLATMEKDLSLLNMAYREPAKRTISEVLRSTPAWNKEWVPAEMKLDGTRMAPVDVKNSRVGTMYYLHNGEVQAFYGPRALVDQFMYGDAIEADLLAKFAHHASRHIQNLWTQLNYGFWPVAYTRDIGAFRDQMPGTTRFGKRSYWNYRKRAIRAAKSSILGRPNEDAKRSLEKKDLITHPDPRGDYSDETPIDQLMRQYHIEPVNWKGDQVGRANAIMRTLKHWWEIYKSWGQVRERAVKIAGRLYLEDNYWEMPEARKSELIHEMSGSPNFLESQGGIAGRIINGILPFYNPIKEGVYSAAKSWKQRPLERSWKFMKYTALPLLGMEALRRGMLTALLGNEESDELKLMLNSIPKYDWDNYKVVPLGWADKANKKVAYLRIPMHETERVMRGALAKVLRADEDPVDGGTLLNVAGGQLPGLNPFWKVGAAWYTYKSSGRAPVDMYSGIKIMSDDQAMAGKGDLELLKYTANNLGAGILVRFDYKPLDASEPTWMEKVLRLPIISNSLGRWVKISNRGVTDKLRPVTEKVERRRAETRLDAQGAIRDVMDGKRMKPADMMRMVNDPYYAEYFTDTLKDATIMRQGSPEFRAISDAPSKESRMAIMQELLQDQ